MVKVFERSIEIRGLPGKAMSWAKKDKKKEERKATMFTSYVVTTDTILIMANNGIGAQIIQFDMGELDLLLKSGTIKKGSLRLDPVD